MTDGNDKKISALIMKRRDVLDRIDAAECTRWADVWTMVRGARP